MAGKPGWWNEAWKHYAGVMVEESEGLTRTGEPVHVTIGFFSDRITDPAREIRVVTYEPKDPRAGENGYVEVPSQVAGVSVFDDEKLLGSVEKDEKTGSRILRYSATTTVDLAFLADGPAHARRPYLVFYGNPDAKKPVYETDLRVTGEGLGLTVENGFFHITHAENSSRRSRGTGSRSPETRRRVSRSSCGGDVRSGQGGRGRRERRGAGPEAA